MPPKNRALKAATTSATSSGSSSSSQGNTLNYYQNKIHKALDLELVLKEFFDQIHNQNIHHISDFLGALTKRKVDKLPDENLQKILGKINSLSLQKETEPSVKELGIILNSLSSLGYQKSDLQNLEIKNLIKIFNKQERLNCKDLINTLGCCARLSYDKDELEIDAKKLDGAINLQFGNLSGHQKISLLSSIARLGYDANNFDLFPSLLKISQAALKEAEAFDGKEIAALVHSCAKLEIFEPLFNERSRVNLALTPSKISALSPPAAFSLLQAQMFAQLLQNNKIFDDLTIAAIAEKSSLQEIKISNLQQSVADALTATGSTKLEHPIYEVLGRPVRNVDILHQIKTATESEDYFIEIDGPNHYFRSQTNQYNVDSATRTRSRINRLAIASRSDSISKSYYLEIPFYEIEQNKEFLTDFLANKLATAKEIEIENYQKFLLEPTQPDLTSTSIVQSYVAAMPTLPDNKKSNPKKSKTTDSAKKNPKTNPSSGLQLAIEKCNLADVESAIRAGMNINQSLENGFDPLSFAIQCNIASDFFPDCAYSKILNTLIGAGADISNSVAATCTDKKKLGEILDEAIMRQDEALVCALIKLDTVSLKQDAIVKAVRSNSVKIVDSIIEKHGFDPNSDQSKLALNLAAKGASTGDCTIKILNSLINKAGIDSKFIEDNSNHSLKLALLEQSLLNNCTEIFTPIVKQNKISPNLWSANNGFNLLHLATAVGSEEIVRFLTDTHSGYGVNINDVQGFRTPLIIAASNRNLNIAKILIEERQANPNQVSAIGSNAIYEASLVRDLELVTYLAENGADVNLSVNMKKLSENNENLNLAQEYYKYSASPTALMNAVIVKRADIAKVLAAHGAKFELETPSGITSLLNSATVRKEIDYITTLIEAGADFINPQPLHGKTFRPIELAFSNPGDTADLKSKSSEIVKLFIEKGVDPNTMVNNSKDPIQAFLLALVSEEIGLNTLQLMIYKGADCEGSKEETRFKKTIKPIQLLLGLEKSQAVERTKLLLDNGADPDTVMTNGASILVWAIQTNNLKMVQLLAEYGANLQKIDSLNNLRPLEFAQTVTSNVSQELCDFLEESVKNLNSSPAVSIAQTSTTSLAISQIAKTTYK